MPEHPRPDDLSDLERRLTAWRPSPAGLNADALLFAAGRAAGRPGPGRVLWPVVAGSLAVLVAVLGQRLAAERAERLALVELFQQRGAGAPAEPAAAPVSPAAPPPSDSYLAARRVLERQPDAWLARTTPGPRPAPPPDLPTLRAWGRAALDP